MFKHYIHCLVLTLANTIKINIGDFVYCLAFPLNDMDLNGETVTSPRVCIVAAINDQDATLVPLTTRPGRQINCIKLRQGPENEERGQLQDLYCVEEPDRQSYVKIHRLQTVDLRHKVSDLRNILLFDFAANGVCTTRRKPVCRWCASYHVVTGSPQHLFNECGR